MSDKLNSSLDDILKANPRSSTRRGRGTRRAAPGRRAEAPIGGVAKATKQTKPNKAAPSAPAGPSGGETKIMISNLVSSPFVLYRYLLTLRSRLTLRRISSRYVRPSKVFEPVYPSNMRANASPTK